MSIAVSRAARVRSRPWPGRWVPAAAVAAWLLLGLAAAGAAERPLGLEQVPAASPATGFAPVSPMHRVRITADAAWLGDPAARRVRLTLHGQVAPGFYIYALTDGSAAVPVATRLEVQGAMAGDVTESPPQTIQDAVFDGPRRVHRGTFRISQALTLAPTAAVAGTLHGTLIYYVCDGRICSDERRLAFVAAVTGG